MGIDDGKFIPHTMGSVIIIGVVLRGGCWLDGVMHTTISIDGMDATKKIASMVNESPHRRQLRLIMLNGITFGGFNIVDITELFKLTQLPVISLTREKPDLKAIHEALKHLPQTEERWRMVLQAGALFKICCKGATLYVGLAGIDTDDAQKIIELASTRSSFPEPLRIAHLIASGITS